MFRFLLNLLREPEGRKLELVSFKEKYNRFRNETEIIEGILISKKSNKIYPIWNGIPRMLPDSLKSKTSFYKKYRSKLAKYGTDFNEEEIKKFIRLNQQVKSRFEFEWKIWGKAKRVYGMDQEEYKYDLFYRRSSKRVNDDYFKGKIVLEVGCGHGMCTQIFSPLCKEYVGIDIGDGIDCARWRSKNLPNIHLIQGDILTIPLKENYFDYVFSVGVIHHTPDTYKAFCNLAKIPKKGGDLMIWVYPKGGFFWENVNKFVRFFTTKFPPKLLYYISYFIVPVLIIVPAYAPNKIGKNTWKELCQSIYDWLSPAYQTHHTLEEVIGWYKNNGFKEIEFADIKLGVTGIKI